MSTPEQIARDYAAQFGGRTYSSYEGAQEALVGIIIAAADAICANEASASEPITDWLRNRLNGDHDMETTLSIFRRKLAAERLKQIHAEDFAKEKDDVRELLEGKQ